MLEVAASLESSTRTLPGNVTTTFLMLYLLALPMPLLGAWAAASNCGAIVLALAIRGRVTKVRAVAGVCLILGLLTVLGFLLDSLPRPEDRLSFLAEETFLAMSALLFALGVIWRRSTRRVDAIAVVLLLSVPALFLKASLNVLQALEVVLHVNPADRATIFSAGISEAANCGVVALGVSLVILLEVSALAFITRHPQQQRA